MSKYKVLVTSPAFNKENLSHYRMELEFFGEVIYNPLEKPLEPKEIINKMNGVHAIIAGLDSFDEEILSKAPEQLKIISRFGAGYERVDIKAAGKRGIAVANTPGANASGVADLTMGLIIDVMRKISRLNHKMRQGIWQRPMGMELQGKTLGIIGFGAIGKEVARRGKGFAMNMVAFDPCVSQDIANDYQVKMLSLEEVLKKADILTLHVPVVKETFRLINEDRIKYMKKGVILINTARGELLDETVLYHAVKRGHVAGVGLDAFEVEPPLDNPLIQLEQVTATPHIGAHTHESSENMARMAIENIKLYLEKGQCPRIVNHRYLKSGCRAK